METIAATPRTRLVGAVARALRENSVQLAGQRVAAMVSGGVDSIVLADVLASLPTGLRPAGIVLVFCDHALRDVQAERDLVARAAGRLGVPLVQARAGDDFASDRQARARSWRYEVAQQVAVDHDCHLVASGHTADDQLETMLLGLISSSGARAMRGIPFVQRGLGPVPVIRPLLAHSRELVAAHARERGLEFAVDPTNEQPLYRRNRLRSQVVPALLAESDGAAVHLERSRRQLQELTQIADELAALELERRADGDRFSLAAWEGLSEPVRRELIAAWLRRADLGRSLSSRLIASVAELAVRRRGSVSTRSGRVTCDGERLVLERGQ